MFEDKKPGMKSLLFFGLVVALVITSVILIFGVHKKKQGFLGPSQLSANSLGEKSEVLLDGKKIGDTPFNSDSINSGEHLVTLKNQTNIYEVTTPFYAASQVVINRDLGISKNFSSGQNFWLDKKDLSSKVNIVSEPSQATVYIDEVEVGKTPYSSSVLSDGEYDLKISAVGYENQVARIKIHKDYKLNVSVKLFLLPISSQLTNIAGSKMMYDLSSDNNDLILDVPSWVKGVSYFTNTRGTSVKFSYFVDYLGMVYDKDGASVAKETKVDLKSGDAVGYLGRKSDNGLTKEATSVLSVFVGLDLGVKRVKVTTTGTGWLRVRVEPSLSASEIGKLNVGDEVFVLEETSGWMKIRLSDGKEGWISSSYVSEVK